MPYKFIIKKRQPDPTDTTDVSHLDFGEVFQRVPGGRFYVRCLDGAVQLVDDKPVVYSNQEMDESDFTSVIRRPDVTVTVTVEVNN